MHNPQSPSPGIEGLRHHFETRQPTIIMTIARAILVLLFALLIPFASAEEGKHLFILSGQSNMARMVTTYSFTPTVQEAFGKNNVVVVKIAQSGQPIRRWSKNWQVQEGQNPAQIGDIYDRMIRAVLDKGDPKGYASVTFIWMQGESDANQRLADYYESAFLDVLEQLQTDLGRDDINIVIGRLSDFDLENKRYRHWTRIREIQVGLAEKLPHATWVDTDDLNDGFNADGEPIENDLHYSSDGYVLFGKRLADAAISLIKESDHSN